MWSLERIDDGCLMPETSQFLLKVLAWQGATGRHSARIEKGVVPLHVLLSIEKRCIKQRGLKPVASNSLSASTARAGPVEGHQQA